MSSVNRGLSNFFTQYRLISFTTSLLKRSHYDTLGIRPNATIADIKNAYYNLSMKYHPDRSDGSAETLEKFREITEAYEILSNVSTKRFYDRGIDLQSKADLPRRPKLNKKHNIEENNTNVYYDFDVWSKMHYGENVARRATAKEKYYSMISENQGFEERMKVASAVLTVFSIGFLCWICIELRDNDSYGKKNE